MGPIMMQLATGFLSLHSRMFIFSVAGAARAGDQRHFRRRPVHDQVMRLFGGEDFLLRFNGGFHRDGSKHRGPFFGAFVVPVIFVPDEKILVQGCRLKVVFFDLRVKGVIVDQKRHGRQRKPVAHPDQPVSPVHGIQHRLDSIGRFAGGRGDLPGGGELTGALHVLHQFSLFRRIHQGEVF